MYYKFRDLKNYKYIVDIFLNQRLYSGSFRNLNDDLEGQFFSAAFQEIKRVRLNPKEKEHISVCSFSENYKNHLMWSHYADGHRGIAIGFEIDDSTYTIEKVNYNGLVNFNYLPNKFLDIKSVFLNKTKDFSYEEEFRIIIEKPDYVNIQIKEVFFGAETPDEDKKIISALVNKINPDVILDTYYS